MAGRIAEKKTRDDRKFVLTEGRISMSSKGPFELSDPEILREAVSKVFVKYQSDGLKPGAEHWHIDTRIKRPMLISDIRKKWLEIIGECDPLFSWFPWHDDYVLCCFVSVRKLSQDQKLDLCYYYDLEVPAEWSTKKECLT